MKSHRRKLALLSALAISIAAFIVVQVSKTESEPIQLATPIQTSPPTISTERQAEIDHAQATAKAIKPSQDYHRNFGELDHCLRHEECLDIYTIWSKTHQDRLGINQSEFSQRIKDITVRSDFDDKYEFTISYTVTYPDSEISINTRDWFRTADETTLKTYSQEYLLEIATGNAQAKGFRFVPFTVEPLAFKNLDEVAAYVKKNAKSKYSVFPEPTNPITFKSSTSGPVALLRSLIASGNPCVKGFINLQTKEIFLEEFSSCGGGAN